MENGRHVADQLAVLGARKGKGKLLEEIARPREVEEAFFASGATRMPAVAYAVDRDAVGAQIAELGRIEVSIELVPRARRRSRERSRAALRCLGIPSVSC